MIPKIRMKILMHPRHLQMPKYRKGRIDVRLEKRKAFPSQLVTVARSTGDDTPGRVVARKGVSVLCLLCGMRTQSVHVPGVFKRPDAGTAKKENGGKT